MSSSTRPAPFAPSVHIRALLTWLAVYPTITLALIALRPWIGSLPIAVQTLILTAIVVPVAAYGLMPLLMRTATTLSRRNLANSRAR